ncbi:MAG: type I restriction endonuclease subunit R [bacterium]|nr:type I restriction endonuclease subunit R [bacterium]
MKFNEAQLEAAILELLAKAGYPHVPGESIKREPRDVLIKDDLRTFLAERHAKDHITSDEIDAVIHKLKTYPAADLYESNKAIMKLVADGFLLKRKDRKLKDLYIQLIDYSGLAAFRQPKADDLTCIVAQDAPVYKTGGNIFKMVNQMEILGSETRIPDGILYINGLPLVVFEFKSAVRIKATIHDAFVQLTVRYKRDIPQLFKYNAFCVISDGVNNRVGSFFAAYEFFSSWRKVDSDDSIEKDGINSLYSMINGLFNPTRLCDVIRNFIFLPDTSRAEEKILCRYPQYYAATKLYQNILKHKRPTGDGKGGTYFGATGCGKSYTMLFLTRLLMKSAAFESPTIVLITDRTDLDDQLSGLFGKAKGFIGDDLVVSVKDRDDLRERLKGRQNGGVFLTTIQKFTEDTQLLTTRANVICISDEAHRSQVNLDQKVKVTKDGVKRTFGFAKYLHDSLPRATYVGFTGTPIDATLGVFGPVIDAYTMKESVADDITVRIIYEGRAAKVLLDSDKLDVIEDYYAECADQGTSEYAIESSKKANLQMNAILGDPDRLKALAADFISHYETRISEGATVAGKAMFVCSNRHIAYQFYKQVIAKRPQWAQKKVCADTHTLTEEDKKTIMPMERFKMVMTRNPDDEKKLYDMLGSKEYRKKLDNQFKNEKSNFKIAVVVDMWLTGFDVPFLDTMYIDKPVNRHNLIQTISRVNRKFQHKEKGLIVDYIGIKKQMNQALAQYSKVEGDTVEEISQSVLVVKDHLDLMAAIFHHFDSAAYFTGEPLAQLQCLNKAAEYVQLTNDLEKRFMFLAKRMKAAYDICLGSDELSQEERDRFHFYMAVRGIVFKLTRGDAPDLAQMNARVRKLIEDALASDGVQDIFKLGQEEAEEVDIFSPDYLAKIDKIKLPHTKIKLLRQLLTRAIDEFKKVNRLKGLDFSQQFKALVDRYNERSEADVLSSEVLEDFTEEIIGLYHAMKKEKDSFADLGIGFEEKAFYDILKALTVKYDFEYPEDKLVMLAKEVKVIVDDKAKYTDWSRRIDIKAELKADLIILLAENDYPPVDRDEVYKEIFRQAENFKKYRKQKA